MKLIHLVVAAFIFFVSVDVHADRVDQLEGMSDTDYCAVIADQFYAGALSQIGGHARRLTALTPMVVEMVEHGMGTPKDGMYVPEFDSLTDREKQWMSTNVLLGYDEAAKVKDLTDEGAQKMTQSLFEGCMYKRTAQKRSELKPVGPACCIVNVASSEDTAKELGRDLAAIDALLKSASSEKIIDEQFCKDRLFDINKIAGAIHRRLSQEHVEAVARRSPELSPDRLAMILLMVDEAYHYTGDLTEWMKSRAKDCM